MGRSQYHHRRDSLVDDHSPTQGRECHGHRRVSVEQGGAVMRILRLERSTELLANLAMRGAADTSRVEPVVRKIVSNVRKQGDAALRRYASKFDGLGDDQALRVS